MCIMNCLNKKIITLILCLSSVVLWAQPTDYDLAAIAKQYKGNEAVMVSSNDDIVIDFDKTDKIRIRNNHSHDVYFVGANTKMYDDEYISHSFFNEITSLKALLYEFDGKKFKKKEITNVVQADNFSSNVFYEESKYERVVFPQIPQGSLSSISYVETYNDPHFMQSLFIFSSYMPVNKAEVSILFPKNVTIKYKIFNDNGKIAFKQESIGKNIKYTWITENVEKYNRREEDFAITYYEPHVGIYISDYTIKGKQTDVLKDVNSLYKWKENNLKTINKDSVPALKKLVDSLCVGKNTQIEKAKAIFYWVQSNIKYVAFEGGYSGFIPREAKDIFNNRYGDCKDMSSIQTKMYEYAGINSHLVSIGTRDIPYTFEEFPTENVDNHMIAVEFIDGKHYFTDGTAYFISFDFPSDAIQGKEALISDGDNYILEKVPIVDKVRTQSIDTISLTFNADTLKGISHATQSGYIKFNTSINLIRTPQNKWKEMLMKHLSRGSNKYKLETVAIDTIDRDKDLNLRTTFSIPNYVKNAGNSYYINFNLDRSLQNDKVDTTKQKFDKKIDFKHILSYEISMNIPKGFRVSKLPTTSEYTDGEFGFKAKYRYDENLRKIVYSFQIYIDAITIKATRFDQWNAMIKKLCEVYSQVVVLEKI